MNKLFKFSMMFLATLSILIQTPLVAQYANPLGTRNQQQTYEECVRNCYKGFIGAPPEMCVADCETKAFGN